MTYNKKQAVCVRDNGTDMDAYMIRFLSAKGEQTSSEQQAQCQSRKTGIGSRNQQTEYHRQAQSELGTQNRSVTMITGT